MRKCEDCHKPTPERCPIQDCASADTHLLPTPGKEVIYICGACSQIFAEPGPHATPIVCDECAQTRRLKAAFNAYLEPRGLT
jgi:DNA-directed RNA polymerase subunit RPC12/RpoP